MRICFVFFIISGYSINENGTEITTTLQDLVNNGYLRGSNLKEEVTKVIINPVTNKNIGSCEIIIKRDNSNNKIYSNNFASLITFKLSY